MPRVAKLKKTKLSKTKPSTKTAAATGKTLSSASKTVKTPLKSVASSLKKPRKARVGNVREKILKALEAGAKSRSVIQKSTGASYNGLVMHLSKMRDEGIVTFDASNRFVSLADAPTISKPTADAAESTTKPSSSTSTAIARISHSSTLVTLEDNIVVLKDALALLTDRFKPVQALDEKVLVLDSLSSQIGGPIAEVLAGIKADLMRSI